MDTRVSRFFADDVVMLYVVFLGGKKLIYFNNKFKWWYINNLSLLFNWLGNNIINMRLLEYLYVFGEMPKFRGLIHGYFRFRKGSFFYRVIDLLTTQSMHYCESVRSRYSNELKLGWNKFTKNRSGIWGINYISAETIYRRKAFIKMFWGRIRILSKNSFIISNHRMRYCKDINYLLPLCYSTNIWIISGFWVHSRCYLLLHAWWFRYNRHHSENRPWSWELRCLYYYYYIRLLFNHNLMTFYSLWYLNTIFLERMRYFNDVLTVNDIYKYNLINFKVDLYYNYISPIFSPRSRHKKRVFNSSLSNRMLVTDYSTEYHHYHDYNNELFNTIDEKLEGIGTDVIFEKYLDLGTKYLFLSNRDNFFNHYLIPDYYNIYKFLSNKKYLNYYNSVLNVNFYINYIRKDLFYYYYKIKGPIKNFKLWKYYAKSFDGITKGFRRLLTWWQRNKWHKVWVYREIKKKYCFKSFKSILLKKSYCDFVLIVYPIHNLFPVDYVHVILRYWNYVYNKIFQMVNRKIKNPRKWVRNWWVSK